MVFVRGQLAFADQLNSAFAATFPAGGVSAYSATLLTGQTQSAWFTALGMPAGAPGSANGLATLDGTGVVPAGQLPPAITGAMFPKGGWNATTNSPALVSGAGTKGFFYVVTTAGTTSLDGNSTWSLGDCLFFDGTVWRKINASGNVTIPSTSITDSTAVGRALLTSASVPAQRASLRVDQVQNVVDTDQTITNAMQCVAWTSLTASRVGTLPAASSMNPGQDIYIYDESGNCSSAMTITLNTVGGDTINLGSSYVLSTQFAGVVLVRASSTKWTALPLEPDTSGFRNRLINGDMRVDQRNAGAAQTFTASGPLAYAVDRWYAYCTGASITGQQIVGAPPEQFVYRFTVGAPVTSVNFAQRIEAANCYDFAGTTVTLSTKQANSLLTTVTWAAYYANATDTFGTVASPTKTIIATGTFTINSTLTKYTTQITVPSAATTGIEVLFSIGSQSSGTWTIGACQLERGFKSTTFERLPINVLLGLCQRYFWVTPITFAPVFYAPSGGFGFDALVPFSTQMRATPTATSGFTNVTNCSIVVTASNAWANLFFTSAAAGILNANYVAGNTFSAEL